jgi:hypothetical protein
MKMTMRYAHLSPAFLSAEVSLLDPPPPAPAPPDKGKKSARARKGQRVSKGDQPRSQVPGFVQEIGSSGPPSLRPNSESFGAQAGLGPATLNWKL